MTLDHSIPNADLPGAMVTNLGAERVEPNRQRKRLGVYNRGKEGSLWRISSAIGLAVESWQRRNGASQHPPGESPGWEEMAAGTSTASRRSLLLWHRQ